MNSLNVLFDNPLWIIVCAVIGMLVLLVVSVVVLYLVYHIVRGFVFACSFMRWSYRVMSLNGRKPKRHGFMPVFLSAWFRCIGYVNNGNETISQGRSVWRGYGDHNAFDEKASQFVTGVTQKYTAKSPAKPKAKRARVPQHKPRPALVPLHELQTDDFDEEEIACDAVGDYFHQMANDAADEAARDPDIEDTAIGVEDLHEIEEDAELQKMVAGGSGFTPTVSKHVKRKRRK